MSESTDIVVAEPAADTDWNSVERGADGGSMWSIVERRWRVLLLVSFVSAAAACSAIWYLVQPAYSVEARIKVAPKVRPILSADSDTDISRQYGTYLATEGLVLTSPSVIRATLDDPAVAALPWVRQQPAPANAIAESLEVEQVRGTYVLTVSMTGDEPEALATIVNALVDAYVRQHHERKRQSDEDILRSLRAQARSDQAKLDGIRSSLQQLAAESGAVGAGESGTVFDAQLRDLRKSALEADLAREVARSKIDTLNQASETGAEPRLDPEGYAEFLQEDATLAGLYERLSHLETEAIADRRQGRGPLFPGVAERTRDLADTRQKIDERVAQLKVEFVSRLRARFEAELFDAELKATVLRGQLDRLSADRSAASDQGIRLAEKRHERDRIEESLWRVRDKIYEVEIEQYRAERVTVDARAVPPEEPNIDKRLKYCVAATLLSLFLGTVAALLRDRMDTSVRDPIEVTSRLGMPLLGSVQQVPNLNGSPLVCDDRVMAPMRGISTALLTTSPKGPARARLITSPTPGSGKSSLALNLAQSLAWTDRKVLLVDGDNSGRGVTRAFQLDQHRGLKELLDGTCGAGEVIETVDANGLHVLPAGEHGANFGALLARQRTKELLRGIFAAYDEVIVDSPPVLASPDSVVLATLLDEIVLVLRAGSNTREEAEAARRHLAAVGTKPVGVILNGVDPRSTRYGYGYGYGYGYARAGDEARAS